ncbi:MAG: ABC transporter permease [Armatimonadetes bacterium]|nr:ABC transporter permease [Armatimonadota bacterium]
MLAFIVRRLLSLIPVLLLITLAVFLLIHIVPGDAATYILSEGFATAEDVDKLRRELGLDQPIWVQYVRYLNGIARLNFGRSLYTRRPLLDEITARFPASVELALASIAIAVLIGLFAGMMAAVRHNTLWDRGITTSVLFGFSMPDFWLGLMLIFLFAVRLGWVPATGRGGVVHLILPALTLGIASSALIARMTRSSLLDTLRQDYVRTARAKGLDEHIVLFKHALKNSLIPTVTVVGLQFGTMLGRVVVTESVFAWPGIGRLLLDAINARDLPLIQGIVLVIATSFVLINLAVDILYSYLDPRIRYH